MNRFRGRGKFISIALDEKKRICIYRSLICIRLIIIVSRLTFVYFSAECSVLRSIETEVKSGSKRRKKIYLRMEFDKKKKMKFTGRFNNVINYSTKARLV